MHNLYLGTAKYFLKKILKKKGYLLESHLELIQSRINRFTVPNSVCRIRLKIESGFSRLTADQWKTWVLYFSLIALQDVVNSEILEVWRMYVMTCRLHCTREISIENAKIGDEPLLQLWRVILGKTVSLQTCIITVTLWSALKTMGLYRDFGVIPLNATMDCWCPPQTTID